MIHHNFGYQTSLTTSTTPLGPHKYTSLEAQILAVWDLGPCRRRALQCHCSTRPLGGARLILSVTGEVAAGKGKVGLGKKSLP